MENFKNTSFDEIGTMKLLNTKQVAEFLGVTERTVKNLVKDGKLVGHHVGRLVRYFPSDVMNVLQ